MKDYEKFEKRLNELGLYDEWCKQGSCGKIAKVTEDGIIILCNEGESDKIYSETHFPPLSEMAQDDSFRLNALYEFCDHEDSDFVYRLCKWVARPNTHACPLYPVDVYFCWEHAITNYFEDDKEVAGVMGTWDFDSDKTEEYCPHCDTCVDLEDEFKVQRCPNCGTWIVPCSICPLGSCVAKCPLERYAIILNGGNKDE